MRNGWFMKVNYQVGGIDILFLAITALLTEFGLFWRVFKYF
jgi:hypothetical protein